MSGTSYGAVLHVAPERRGSRSSATATRSGSTRRSADSPDVLVDAELERRRASWEPPSRKDERGYRLLHADHVLQANEGCDFDFLRGKAPVVQDAVTYP